MFWKTGLQFQSKFFKYLYIWMKNFSLTPNYRGTIGIFRPCSRYVSSVPRSRYVSSVLEVYFDILLCTNSCLDYSVSVEHSNVHDFESEHLDLTLLKASIWLICL